jgi:hypothetical protein
MRDTFLESFANAVGSNSQRIERHLELLGQVCSPLNSCTLLSLVIGQNDLLILDRLFFQTIIKTKLTLLVLRILKLRLDLGQMSSFVIDIDDIRFLKRLQKHEICGSVRISHNVIDALTLINSSSYSVERFVGAVVS